MLPLRRMGKGRRPTTGNVIVVEAFDAPPSVVADDDVDEDADSYRGRIDVHGVNVMPQIQANPIVNIGREL